MTVSVHVGELLSGRIIDTIPVTSLRWFDVLNGAGSIDVTIQEEVVRKRQLRQKTHGVRCFLAVERDGRIKSAGPIWTRRRNWENGTLTLGAAGVWSWLDRRIIIPNAPTLPFQKNVVTVTGKSLGGVARALVELAITAGSTAALPIVLPPDEAGDHTESWPAWRLLDYGEQLRQITQRATDAPDIAFRARRRGDDARFLEWVMQTGTEAFPTLSQGGSEWVLDTSAPKSPVRGISTDEDATAMAEQVYVTGNGMEEDILFSTVVDTTLLSLGWPYTQATASHSTVEDQATLDGHAASLLARFSRPVEVFKATVSADAVNEVLAGDYARLITKGDAWLGDMDKSMRIRQVSGGMGDVVLDMFPLQAAL